MCTTNSVQARKGAEGGRLCRLEPVTFILLEKSFFKDQLGEFLTNIKFWASSPETGFNLVELDPGICILKVAL